MGGVSVIITTYHPGRRGVLDEIARAWLEQPVDQVWVLNSGAQWLPPPPVGGDVRFQIFNLPLDLGNGADYCFALMTSGDYVILADDDMVPLDGFVGRFLEHSDKADILGVMGRIFRGPKYRRDTFPVRGDSVGDSHVAVDFVGVCTFCRREHFGFDVRGLFPVLRNCDDLWWQMKKMPGLSKAVIPLAGLYRDLKEVCKGPTSMFKNIDLRQSRQDFYERHYLGGQYHSAVQKEKDCHVSG